MITTLRRLFGSTLGKFVALAFIVLIGVLFALADVTGTSSPLGGVGGASAVKVGDASISIEELRNRVRQSYNQARQQQPGLTMAAFVESGGLDQALNQTVDGLAFEQFAEQLGFAVSKRQIDGRIADIPAFAGVSGKFDQKAFESFMQQNGLTEAQIRRELKQQLLLEQLGVPIGSLPRVAAGMAQPYAALLLEQRRGQALFIPSSAFAPAGDPGDAALQTYLAQNKSKFTIPERRVLQYALFDRSAVPVPAVSDAEIAKAYKANAAQYAASETRRFAQVIAPDQATANSIAAKVRGGATLAAAAQASGLSASTTSELTQQAYAAQSSAATAKAAFTAKRGDVVGPLQEGLGWTVARVESVTAKPARNLAEATPEIRTELQKNKANEAIVDYYNAIQDAVNSGASIEEIAADRKLKVETTPALLPSGRAPGLPGFVPSPELAPMVSGAFQGSEEGEGHIATLVENEKFAVYSVKSIVAAAPPPFAQIRGEILSDWRFAQGQKVARDKARAIVKAVEGGKGLSEAANAAGAAMAGVQTIGGRRADLGRDGKPVPPELALLFSMAKGSVKTLEVPGNRGWMVLALGDVDRPNPKDIEPARVAAIAQPLAPAIGNELVEQLAAEAKRRVGVTINKELVEQLRKELTGAAPVGE
ncbi:SurA N-terminal domain-containing protein [Sphingopyxis sp. BSN-002]|uniref:peptidylprolyl isomerase n=1 Tax=Sphingopyxis sp. BSN-002 TaxID=2911495 RepID=UPI001EDB9316|nr:peptidylprolyl isomerase [Sphingopyxis sp. BSN-002]UKK85043.1 SurA N-terminal domain-containing protein [Sphingopyxis sp. BSN-002]